jgi:Glycosyltransferase like family
MTEVQFTLAAAVSDRTTLQQNLLASPALVGQHSIEVLVKEGFASASLAYNCAIDEAQGDIIVFAHQDIYLPAHWFRQVLEAIGALESARVRWGVLGCFGSTKNSFGGLGRVYTNGLGLHGNPIAKPESVETLDEIVLILRKSSGLRFDANLPHFHMYGVDICLSARRAGLPIFAVPAFCVHNTNQLLELPPEFYTSYRFVKRKWSAYLPIAASCMSLTRMDGELRRKQLAEMLARLRPAGRTPLRRVNDPRSLLPDEFWRQVEAEPVSALSRSRVADTWSAGVLDAKTLDTSKPAFRSATSLLTRATLDNIGERR